MDEFQVVVVGGGPAGGECARLLAEKGIDTLILERGDRIGEPIQCAGLISPRTYELGGSSCRILNRIKGGTVYSPGGKSLRLFSNEEKAYVIDRAEFDQGILEKAQAAGACLSRGARVVEVREANGRYTLKYLTKDGEKYCGCDYLVGADGSGSFIRKAFDFPEPPETLLGYGSHGHGADIPGNEVIIITGELVAPGFFAWIIPEGDNGGARVGLCIPSTRGAPVDYYRKLMLHPVARKYLQNYKADKYIAGKIELGLLDRCVRDKCALVGDSAAMAKPVSGGGVYPALIAARELADNIYEMTESNISGHQGLLGYQNFIDRKMRPNIARAMSGRKIYQKLTIEEIDRAFSILQKERVLDYIVKKGDIDNTMDIIPGVVLRAPKLASFGLSILSSLMKR